MKVDRREMERSLQQKGFERDEHRSDIYYHFYHKGKKTGIYTKLSHTKKMRDISGGLLTAIRKQLGLDSTREAFDLLTCPMDEDRYSALLVERDRL